MFGRTVFLLFIVSYFVRFTPRFPVLGSIRFELLLGCVILLAVLIQSYEDKWRFKISLGRRLYLFLAYVLLSLPFVTWPGSVMRFHLTDWIKVALLYIFIVALIRTQSQLKLLFSVFMATQFFRILEPLYLHITTGYWGSEAFSMAGGVQTFLNRLSGAPHDVVNPNQLAWVVVNMVPFLYYLCWKSGKWGKLLAVCTAPPFVYCLLLTGSRSGLLCLIFVVATIVFFTQNRWRNVMLALAVGIPLSLTVFAGLGGDLQTRYLSLIDSSVAGADTVKGRIDGLITGVWAISHNPLFGNGLGTSAETNVNIVGGLRQLTHNLYLEVIQETGIIGFILFASFLVAMFKCLVVAKSTILSKGYTQSYWLFRMTIAVQVWMIMDLFYSLSCFGLRSWEWYFFGGVSTVCLALAKELTPVSGAASDDQGRYEPEKSVAVAN